MTTVAEARGKLQAKVAAVDADLQRQYSEVVRKAAADKKLTATDVQAAADAAEVLGLADEFDADVAAVRQVDFMQQSLEALEKLQPGERVQMEALRSELANLERRMIEVRREQRKIGGRGMERGTFRTQLAEMKRSRPHLWPQEVSK